MADAHHDPLREAIAADILARMAEDVSRGGLLPLDHYLTLFPDHQDLVRRQLRSVQSGSEPSVTLHLGGAGRTPIPERIGPYRVLRRLGRGGQYNVYLAEHVDPPPGRTFAVKVLRSGDFASPEEIERLHKEAEALARIRDDRICRIHELGRTDGGLPYLVLDYVAGTVLADRIRPPSARADGDPEPDDPGDPAEVRRRIGIIETVARALHRAHESGCFHRDVKPSNVIIREDGAPVVLDFGLARIETGDGGRAATIGVGTPAYMSPEQVSESVPTLDPRTDIWSLGVTLYEVLTGYRPFVATNLEGLLQRILHEEPLNPRRLNPAIPDDVRIVIGKCLEKDRGRRYRTAEQLADDLRKTLDGEPIVARSPSASYRVRRWATRNRALAAMLLVVASSLLAGGAVVAGQISARLAALGEAESARDDLSRVHAEALFQLGKQHASRGDWAMAVLAHGRALEAGHPDPFAVRLERMFAFGVRRLGAELAEEVARLRELEEASGIPVRHRGRYLLLQAHFLMDRREDPEAGVTLVRQALDSELSPGDRKYCEAFLAPGILELRARLQEALRADPSHRLAHELHAATLVFTGAPSESARAISAFRALYPDDAAGTLLEAFLQARAGTRETMRSAVDAASSALPPAEAAGVRTGCAFVFAICRQRVLEPMLWPFLDEPLGARKTAGAGFLLGAILAQHLRPGDPGQEKTLPPFTLPPAVIRHYATTAAILLRDPRMASLKRVLASGGLLGVGGSAPDSDEAFERFVADHPADALVQFVWAGWCVTANRLEEAERSWMLAAQGTAVVDLERIGLMLACMPPLVRYMEAKKDADAERMANQRALVRDRLTRLLVAGDLEDWQSSELATLARRADLEDLAGAIETMDGLARGK